MDRALTICRMVHYVSYGTPGGEYRSECRAAVVTGLLDAGHIQLTVFTPTGFFMNDARYAEPGDPPVGGSWHWPDHHLPLST